MGIGLGMSLFLFSKKPLNVLVLALFCSALSGCSTPEQQTQNIEKSSPPIPKQSASPKPGSSSSPWSIILADPTDAPTQSGATPTASTPSVKPRNKVLSPTINQPQGKPAPKQRQLAPKQVAFSATPYAVIDESKQDKFSVNGKQIFSNSYLPKYPVEFNEADLLAVLTNVKTYFESQSQADPDVLREGLLGTGGVTITDIQDTLAFMITVLEQDIALQKPTRLKDPNFINTHFQVVKWQPYNPQQPDQSQLRITKYAVFCPSRISDKNSRI